MSASTHSLSSGQLFCLPRAQGLTILCQSGLLWLTAGDGDIVLHAGEMHTITRPGKLVVEAMRPSQLGVQRGQATAPARTGRPAPVVVLPILLDGQRPGVRLPPQPQPQPSLMPCTWAICSACSTLCRCLPPCSAANGACCWWANFPPALPPHCSLTAAPGA